MQTYTWNLQTEKDDVGATIDRVGGWVAGWGSGGAIDRPLNPLSTDRLEFQTNRSH
jgi:hypothetical protein